MFFFFMQVIIYRKNDVARWEQAYNDISESMAIINACGYGLAHESDPGVNASGWASMFSEVSGEYRSGICNTL